MHLRTATAKTFQTLPLFCPLLTPGGTHFDTSLHFSSVSLGDWYLTSNYVVQHLLNSSKSVPNSNLRFNRTNRVLHSFAKKSFQKICNFCPLPLTPLTPLTKATIFSTLALCHWKLILKFKIKSQLCTKFQLTSDPTYIRGCSYIT